MALTIATGFVVDDAIVVIENTHRIFDNGKVPIVKAAKYAAEKKLSVEETQKNIDDFIDKINFACGQITVVIKRCKGKRST